MPLDLPRLGVRLHGGMPARDCIEIAIAAEGAGFDSVWFAENPFHRSVVPAVAVCLARTGRIAIGIGAVNPYQRHPTLIAQELAALDELAQGGSRVRLGIGAGIGGRIERLGVRFRPLPALEDTVQIVRALLRGETVAHRGRVFTAEEVALDFQPPRPDMPIYFASMGKKSLALCGRLADGLIVSNMCPPAYTERAAAIVRDSADAAGRAMPAIVQYVPCAARPDRETARRLAKEAVAGMLAAFWPASGQWPPLRDTIVQLSGIPKEEVVAALDRLRAGVPADGALDDRFIAAFALAGTAEDCLAQAMRYRAAGVDELVLTFAGNDPARDMAYVAAAALRGAL